MKPKIRFDYFYASNFAKICLAPITNNLNTFILDSLWTEFKKKNRRNINSVTLNTYINSEIDDKYRNI